MKESHSPATRVDITVTTATPDEDIRSLYRWLDEDEQVGRRARISLTGPKPAVGQMGASIDILQLIMDTSINLASLALAIDAWVRARAAGSHAVEVTIRTATSSITVTGTRPTELQEITRLLSASEN